MAEFLEELSKPATEIATILGIVGIVAAWAFARYYYKKGVKTGRIGLDVNQIQVIDRSTLSETPIRIIAKSQNGEREINNNVYVASVAIWNSGNAEIKKEDVRTPYRLWITNAHTGKEKTATAPEVEILELTPTFFSRNNADRFVVEESTGEISWEHFDPREGFKARLIYTGNSMCEIALEGYAVGIGELVDYAKQRKQELARVGWRLELLSPLTVVVVALGGAAILNRIMSSIFSMAISLIVGVIVSALFWMVLSIRLERFRQPPF